MNAMPSTPSAMPPFLAAKDPNTALLAAAMLLGGGVVAIPTDTVYGLAASLERPDAIDRLYDMKSRSPSKTIPVLVSDLTRVSHVANPAPSVATTLAQRYWPGH